MQAVMQRWWNRHSQQLMCIFRACIFRNPTQALGDTVNMGIHREKGLLKAEEQDNGCGLGACSSDSH